MRRRTSSAGTTVTRLVALPAEFKYKNNEQMLQLLASSDELLGAS